MNELDQINEAIFQFTERHSKAILAITIIAFIATVIFGGANGLL